MNLLVKIYKIRYDRHNETLWTTDLFYSVFCLVSCSSKNKFHISKLWPTQIWHVCCSEKKNKQQRQKKKKVKKKNAFRSGLPICHELWDMAFIFFSLIVVLKILLPINTLFRKFHHPRWFTTNNTVIIYFLQVSLSFDQVFYNYKFTLSLVIIRDASSVILGCSSVAFFAWSRVR